MGVIRFIKQLFMHKEQRKASKHHKVLRTWQDMYKDLQTHPLTQAKIINEELLATTHSTIKDFEKRVGEVEKRVEDLENRKITVARKVSKGSPVKHEEEELKMPKNIVKIKKIIADAKLSEQEKLMVNELEKQDEIDAQTIAQLFNISRSNASLKLNKLHNWGFLDKRLEGKSMFFRLKD